MATRSTGTTPPRKKAAQTAQNKGKSGGRTAASPLKNGTTSNKGLDVPVAALNPEFDPRMRRIGSPLNQTATIKRGWIETAPEQAPAVNQESRRVNFLFNPAEVDLSHSMDPNFTKNPNQAPDSVDPLNTWYTSPTGSLSIGLLYDRTYELFSKAAGKNVKHPYNYSNYYGVFADVAAWYTYLGMYSDMPTGWVDAIVEAPPQMIMSYLYVGPYMYYYGYVSSISVSYTHFATNMIPMRCAVSISFALIPKPVSSVTSTTSTDGTSTTSTSKIPLITPTLPDSGGWAGDLLLTGGGN